ncbi:hypothetical protein V6N13_072998 [Hibiscus sabdariffa]|uniref:Uncharacterized protein n=1 Tax=Hibiscus sabdariffa TaxID=183260 RepID=A0ABR2E7T5_9ROSI
MEPREVVVGNASLTGEQHLDINSYPIWQHNVSLTGENSKQLDERSLDMPTSWGEMMSDADVGVVQCKKDNHQGLDIWTKTNFEGLVDCLEGFLYFPIEAEDVGMINEELRQLINGFTENNEEGNVRYVMKI